MQNCQQELDMQKNTLTLFQRTIFTLQHAGISQILTLVGQEEQPLRPLIDGDGRAVAADGELDDALHLHRLSSPVAVDMILKKSVIRNCWPSRRRRGDEQPGHPEKYGDERAGNPSPRYRVLRPDATPA